MRCMPRSSTIVPQGKQLISSFARTVKVNSFRTIQKWVQCNPMVLFTPNVHKMKGVTNKNGDIDSTCTRALTETDNLL